MTEYDLTKMIAAQAPILKDLTASKLLLSKYLHSKKTSSYYMLLCHEKRYYTIIYIDTHPPITLIEKGEDVVIECLQQFGDIITICENNSKDAIECWVKINDEAFLFMLFNYDQGVERCV